MAVIRDREAQEKRLRDITEELIKTLGLGASHAIGVEFDAAADGEERILCRVITDWEYLQATVRWNLVQAAAVTDSALRATAIHELSHILLAPLWGSLTEEVAEPLSKVHELATEYVARTISRLLGYSQTI